MIAHTPFRPYQKGAGVEFLHIEAKGTYDSTGVIWPEQIFKREFDSICILQAKMAWLNALLKEHPIRDEAYLAGLETSSYDEATDPRLFDAHHDAHPEGLEACAP